MIASSPRSTRAASLAILALMQSLLDDLFAYTGFGEDDASTLRAIGPALSPRFDAIVADFYEAIDRTPRAAAVIRGGEPQRARLRASMHDWLAGLFVGVYDAAYVERRARIGRVHVAIRLDQRLMFGAMNRLRRGLHDAICAAELEAELRVRAHVAVDRICDVELAVMLETYRDHYVAQQRAQERLSTLGRLAASIGHELRNPLAVIATSTHLARSAAGDPARLARHLDKVDRQVKLSEGIIGDLLALAGDRPPNREAVDLAALVDDVCESLHIGDGIAVQAHIDPRVAEVFVDGGQLRQVLANLVLNAVQALESVHGGQIEVRATLEDEHELALEVLDDGPGLPPHVHAQIFEPLFTSKAGGLGLGLALCREIVDKHGGRIEARDREGGGAHIELRIPEALKRGEG